MSILNLYRLVPTIALLVPGFLMPCNAQDLTAHEVSEEFQSKQYTVEVNGIPVEVFEASPRVHFASFDFTGEARVEVNGRTVMETGVPLPIRDEQIDGSTPWEGQPIVRPLSRKIKVTANGPSAKFIITQQGQYTLEGSAESQSDIDNKNMVLFLFANPPETDRPNPDNPNVIYLSAGIHQRNIDLQSGQTLYLEAGAVLFGSIDVYDAQDVKILGRGVVFHYGPHSENRDTGYWRKRDWHPLTTRNAERLTVEGITFIARSRTWTIQMHTTLDATFDNVKVLGVNDQNINGDGFDWVEGGGRTVIKNSLIRSSDDAFAFFTPRDSIPEGIVKDILIENCVIWPTRANILRASGYGDSIIIRNCDVIHVPESLFAVPRALLCSVGNNELYATISNVTFEDIRFEEPAALLGIDWENASYRNIGFKNISMAGKPLPLFVKAKKIGNVILDNVELNGKKILDASDLEFKVKNVKIQNLTFID